MGARNGVSGSRKHRIHCLPLPPSTSPTPEIGLVRFLPILSRLVWKARRRRANFKAFGVATFTLRSYFCFSTKGRTAWEV